MIVHTDPKKVTCIHSYVNYRITHGERPMQINPPPTLPTTIGLHKCAGTGLQRRAFLIRSMNPGFFNLEKFFKHRKHVETPHSNILSLVHP